MNSPSPIHRQDSKLSSTTNSQSINSVFERDESMSPTPAKRFGFGMKIGSNIASKNKLGAVFNANEDENNVVEEPKKKLSRLDEAAEAVPSSNSKEASVEDKRKMIKNLIEKIPTGKEELFQYELKWDIVDEVSKKDLSCISWQ